MALYLHLGSSGSGKTYHLYNRILKEAAAEPDRSFFIIVPEQFTLQTQKDMIAMSSSHGIMNIDVLSFPRLVHRIYEELGISEPVILEDTGKSMIVKKVALDCRDKLGIYSSKVGKQGFIDEMKSVIAEFYQYGIDQTRFEEMKKLAEGRGQLQAKLQDIGIIYDGFRSFTEGRYIMNEELLDSFCRHASESKLLKGAVLAFDGFTGFTVSQLNVLEELMKLAKDLHVTITIDPREADRVQSEEDLFYLSGKTILKLEQLAADTGIETVRVTEKEAIPYRFRQAPGLAELEHNIFRRKYESISGLKAESEGQTGAETAGQADGSQTGAGATGQADTEAAGQTGAGTIGQTGAEAAGQQDNIRLVSCDSPVAEIRYVIGEISRLANEEGCRYRDIAIVSGDQATYGSLAEREFRRAGIPCFIDSKHNIIGTAPVELLRAALEAAEYDYTYDSVFRMIKTGMLPMDSDLCSEMENYCLARGIRGRKRWAAAWDKGYRTRYKVDLERLNAGRKLFMDIMEEPLQILGSSKATVAERLDALGRIMDGCGAEERLAASAQRAAASTDEGERLRGREDAQLCPAIRKVFERIGLLLGQDVISLREFREILDTGFKEAKLALIPPGTDTILVGDITRSRVNNIKVLFLVGVNDGIIPGGAADKGLLSDADRSIFAEHDIELSPTCRQNTYLNEFYLYRNMTMPSHRLYLSWHRMTADRKPGRPAYIIPQLQKLFTGLTPHAYYKGDPELMKGTDRAVGAAAIVRDREAGQLNDAERTVLGLLSKEEPGTFERILKAAFFEPEAEGMSNKSASELYKKVLTGSVSLLEKYAQCAFAHFINYGMRLEERPEYEIGEIELGNIYHKAVELYGVNLKEKGISWHSTDEETRMKVAEESLDEALAEYKDLLDYSDRNAYTRTRLEQAVKRTVNVLDAQIKAGSFEPEYFETEFRFADSFMKLSGKIDRMDICERNKKKYLRVIDYKSGSKEFELISLFYGLQLQLALYAGAGRRILEEKGESCENAGMYYYRIQDPYSKQKDPDKVRDDIQGKLKLNGPTRDDSDVLIASDAGFTPEDDKALKAGYSSKIIQASQTKDNLPGRGSVLYTGEQLDRLDRYVDMTVHRMGAEIMEGRTEAAPFRMGGNEACKYCRYKGICGFDRQLGYRYREMHKYGEDHILQIINGVLNSSK